MVSRRAKEITAFVTFIGAIHVAYYAIQNNPSLVPPSERQDLFYVRWARQKWNAFNGASDEK
ncbi:hypothetical protein M3Y99_01434900 [Aphelenchoides fujianensis]|nr:hypothetical protein M3Y99_01434900 [Aphelenchoides fujianensis]